MRRVYVAGAGYVGLVSAVCYAQRGDFVYVYDKDENRSKALASGRSPFFEPGLDQLLVKSTKSGYFEVVDDPVPAVAASDLCIVAVGTPATPEGFLDLSAVLDACRSIGQGVAKSEGYHMVAIRSTVCPGSTSGVLRTTLENSSGKTAGSDFGLVAYPEFLREGSAIHDFFHPSRVVLGECDSRSGDAMEAMIRDFFRDDPCPILRVNATTAEMIKFASNAFLATKITFINEIANLCERVGDVDVGQVADGMGRDPRIGGGFLEAGLGFGGSCLPKDLRALVRTAKNGHVRLRIAEAALASNQVQPLRAIRLARDLMGPLRGRRAAVLGLAFKPGTSDIREAPALAIVQELLKNKMHVSVYDPAAMKNAELHLGKRVRYAMSIRDCLEGADCCFIATEWDEFKTIPSSLFTETMARPIVIDGRRALDRSKLDPSISYKAIGLGRTGRG